MVEVAAQMQSNATICPDFREFLEKVDEVPSADLSTRIQDVCNFLALKERKVYSELDLSGSKMELFAEGGLAIRCVADTNDYSSVFLLACHLCVSAIATSCGARLIKRASGL